MNSVLIGRAGLEKSLSGFILDDFAYADGLGVLFDYQSFNFYDSADVERFLQTAAGLIRRHGGALLSGDVRAFGKFQSIADERERSYIEKMERQHS